MMNLNYMLTPEEAKAIVGLIDRIADRESDGSLRVEMSPDEDAAYSRLRLLVAGPEPVDVQNG